MAPTVMGDAAMALGGQVDHLVFPGIGVERPTMAEDHRLSRAPVFEVDLRVVLGSHRAHYKSPFGFHAIRHLSATNLYHLGYSVSVIQKILRHKNPSTTELYLGSLGLENVREPLERLSIDRNPANKDEEVDYGRIMFGI